MDTPQTVRPKLGFPQRIERIAIETNYGLVQTKIGFNYLAELFEVWDYP